MEMANTLAYDTATITAIKCFIVLAHGRTLQLISGVSMTKRESLLRLVPVGQGSEEEAAQADPAEVQGGCQRGKIMAVTDQRPML